MASAFGVKSWRANKPSELSSIIAQALSHEALPLWTSSVSRFTSECSCKRMGRIMSDLLQKITDVKVWHIRVPVVSTRSHGIGDIEGGFEVVLLRLTTEGGQEGWGEAACWSVFTGSPEASYYALSRYLRPLILGRMVSEREQIMGAALYAIAHATEAKAALESALLDLEGKI